MYYAAGPEFSFIQCLVLRARSGVTVHGDKINVLVSFFFLHSVRRTRILIVLNQKKKKNRNKKKGRNTYTILRVRRQRIEELG